MFINFSEAQLVALTPIRASDQSRSMDDGAADSSRSPQPMHIVIFPWLAFGHLLPGLKLARRLASRGHRVSFVSTPRNLSRLPPGLAPRVDLVPLPLPRVDGLPEGAESTNDVPYEKFGLHRKAFDGLAAPFAACADGEESRPDWVLLDGFHHWAAAAAVDRKVPCALLLHIPASIFAAIAGQPRPDHDETGREEQQPAAAAPAFEAEQRTRMLNTEDESGISVAQRLFSTLRSSSLVGMRTCAELEPDALARLPTLFGKPVVPFGLLPRSPGDNGDNKDGDEIVMSWLDAQTAESVVYVALGSEVPLRADQVDELAHGLDLAGTRFLWALRKPSSVLDDTDLLPPGFEERTRGRGLVATGWVPQVRILAHGAVAAFLTHCGWNSTIEGVLSGHPLIMLPIYGDQGANARLMEARRIGVQVRRDETDGSFDRHGVVSAVRAVVMEESRGAFKANAKKLQESVAGEECHERCVDEFVRCLRSHAR